MQVLLGALLTLGGRELLQLSSTQPFNAINNTTYGFSQPRQRPAERSTHAGPSHMHLLHKYFKEQLISLLITSLLSKFCFENTYEFSYMEMWMPQRLCVNLHFDVEWWIEDWFALVEQPIYSAGAKGIMCHLFINMHVGTWNAMRVIREAVRWCSTRMRSNLWRCTVQINRERARERERD